MTARAEGSLGVSLMACGARWAKRRRLLGAFVYAALAELDLERGPAAVGGLDDRVDLKSALFAVMEHLCIVGFGVDPEIADDEGLEEEAQKAQIVNQALRRGTKRGDCQRRIDEVPFGGFPKNRPRAQVRWTRPADPRRP